MNETNPYETAYAWQNRIIDLEERYQKIKEEIEVCKEEYQNAIARGEATGKGQIDGYTCVTERRTTEKRTIKMDILKATQHDLIMTTGKYDAQLVTKYLSQPMQRMLLKDPDFDSGYKLGLGELDRALGGKKNSAEYVDIEIKEDVKKRITRLPQAPIIEV